MQIHWRHPHAIPEEEREGAERRIEELARDHSNLIDLWIDVAENNHHKPGNESVTIRCQARGKEFICHGRADDPTLALRRALDSFARDVRKVRDRRTDRRVERPAAPPHLGVVDRLFAEEGYGFLLTDAGEQVYFHRNAVGAGLAFAELEEGQRVALNYEPGEKGPQATYVAPAPAGAPSP
jgi:cold shock CspA family protein